MQPPTRSSSVLKTTVSDPLLTVAIPAHNAENSITRLLSSLSSQKTSFGFEILVADDGSTDGTAALAEGFGDGRIRCLRGEKSGVSAARNRLIDAAKGRYIMFADSDDYLLPGALEAAVSALAENGAELVIFGFEIENTDTKTLSPYSGDSALLFSERDYGDNLLSLYARNMLNPCWNKAYSLEFLRKNNIRFSGISYGEDRLFCFDVLCLAPKAAVLSETFYRYTQSTRETLTTKFLPEKFDICLEIDRSFVRLCSRFGISRGKYAKLADYMLVKSALSCLATLKSPSCRLSKKERRGFARAVVRSERLSSCREFPPECGKLFRLSARVLQTRSVTLALLMTSGIHVMTRLFPDRIRRAKHAYNNKN